MWVANWELEIGQKGNCIHSELRWFCSDKIQPIFDEIFAHLWRRLNHQYEHTSNQIYLVTLRLTQLTQASFLQKSNVAKVFFLIFLTLR